MVSSIFSCHSRFAQLLSVSFITLKPDYHCYFSPSRIIFHFKSQIWKHSNIFLTSLISNGYPVVVVQKRCVLLFINDRYCCWYIKRIYKSIHLLASSVFFAKIRSPVSLLFTLRLIWLVVFLALSLVVRF